MRSPMSGSSEAVGSSSSSTSGSLSTRLRERHARALPGRQAAVRAAAADARGRSRAATAAMRVARRRARRRGPRTRAGSRRTVSRFGRSTYGDVKFIRGSTRWRSSRHVLAEHGDRARPSASARRAASTASSSCPRRCRPAAPSWFPRPRRTRCPSPPRPCRSSCGGRRRRWRRRARRIAGRTRGIHRDEAGGHRARRSCRDDCSRRGCQTERRKPPANMHLTRQARSDTTASGSRHPDAARTRNASSVSGRRSRQHWIVVRQ